MQQITKSLGSFTWAMSLFGLQQMTDAIGASTGKSGSNNSIEALNEVTRVSLEQCSASVRETFEVGDMIQRNMVDLFFGVIPQRGGQVDGEPCSCKGPMDFVRNAVDMVQSRPNASQSSSTPTEEELGWGPVPPVA
ncbi:MAG: hypothetical protein ABL921_04600 [Pirellula sp.]